MLHGIQTAVLRLCYCMTHLEVDKLRTCSKKLKESSNLAAYFKQDRNWSAIMVSYMHVPKQIERVDFSVKTFGLIWCIAISFKTTVKL